MSASRLPADGPFRLLHLPSGKDHLFATRAMAAEAMARMKVGRLRGDPTDHIHQILFREEHSPVEWVLTNAYGETLGRGDLPQRKHQWYFGPRHPSGERRRDAVPGTGNHRSCQWRYPRTLRMLREAALQERDDDTGVEVPAPRQARKAIPTAWDDIQRGRMRNWKAQRSNQWK